MVSENYCSDYEQVFFFFLRLFIFPGCRQCSERFEAGKLEVQLKVSSEGCLAWLRRSGQGGYEAGAWRITSVPAGNEDAR